MIVRNEAKLDSEGRFIIQRLINNIHHLCHAYVILDTGSDDNTIPLIKSSFAVLGIPGEVYTQPWVGAERFRFDESRNIALRRCEEWLTGRGEDLKEWVAMFMDADNSLHLYDEPPTTFNGPRFAINETSQERVVVEMRSGNGAKYPYTWMVSLARRWYWCHPRHEYVTTDTKNGPPTETLVTGCYIHSGRDGARSDDPRRYLTDARVLEEYLLEQLGIDEQALAVRARGSVEAREITTTTDSGGKEDNETREIATTADSEVKEDNETRETATTANSETKETATTANSETKETTTTANSEALKEATSVAETSRRRLALVANQTLTSEQARLVYFIAQSYIDTSLSVALDNESLRLTHRELAGDWYAFLTTVEGGDGEQCYMAAVELAKVLLQRERSPDTFERVILTLTDAVKSQPWRCEAIYYYLVACHHYEKHQQGYEFAQPLVAKAPREQPALALHDEAIANWRLFERFAIAAFHCQQYGEAFKYMSYCLPYAPEEIVKRMSVFRALPRSSWIN
jgi:hypothetical protein